MTHQELELLATATAHNVAKTSAQLYAIGIALESVIKTHPNRQEIGRQLSHLLVLMEDPNAQPPLHDAGLQMLARLRNSARERL